MKVLLVCPYAWDAPGGVQVHVRELGARLRERGHEVRALGPALGTAGEDGTDVVGRAIRVPYQGTVAPICFSAGSFARIRRAITELRPDVVHVHEPLVPSASMLAVLAGGRPAVATFHAHAERSRLLDVAAPLVRPVWRRLDARIAVSRAAASFVGSRLGDRIAVIPNGVDVERFATGSAAEDLPAGRRILWVGRLDRQKGFPVAVRAFAELAAREPDLWLVVGGEGRDRSALDALSADVRERVVMLGAVSRDRLPAYHAGADVFVSPALGQESFGLVLVEAMAAGVPVVATDIAGYREVVRDGVDGLLVPPGDHAALASAVRRVLSEPALAGSLRVAGRARAASYDWGAVVERIEEVYRGVARAA
ncbi:MAG TPA: glycosyltransferase family 4 protein [Actinomycetota bacterium]|nr:glycosyltransferase family 4 protein [Actinomycetota bacterium]